MDCEIDIERFIYQIQERPGIWDLSSEDYSNRDRKKFLWDEIFQIFGINDLPSEKEKIQFGKLLVLFRD